MKNDSQTRMAIGDLRRWLTRAKTRIHGASPREGLVFETHIRLHAQYERREIGSVTSGALIDWLSHCLTHLSGLGERSENYLKAHLSLKEKRENAAREADATPSYK